MTTFLVIKKLFKKIKDFVVEYWQAFVAFLLVILGYLLGTRGDTSKIDRSDLKSFKDHKKRTESGQKEIYEKRIEDIEKATKAHEERVNEIKKKTEKEIKDLSNDPEKLDKILKEKYNLNKGD